MTPRAAVVAVAVPHGSNFLHQRVVVKNVLRHRSRSPRIETNAAAGRRRKRGRKKRRRCGRRINRRSSPSSRGFLRRSFRPRRHLSIKFVFPGKHVSSNLRRRREEDDMSSMKAFREKPFQKNKVPLLPLEKRRATRESLSLRSSIETNSPLPLSRRV